MLEKKGKFIISIIFFGLTIFIYLNNFFRCSSCVKICEQRKFSYLRNSISNGNFHITKPKLLRNVPCQNLNSSQSLLDDYVSRKTFF